MHKISDQPLRHPDLVPHTDEKFESLRGEVELRGLKVGDIIAGAFGAVSYAAAVCHKDGAAHPTVRLLHNRYEFSKNNTRLTAGFRLYTNDTRPTGMVCFLTNYADGTEVLAVRLTAVHERYVFGEVVDPEASAGVPQEQSDG